MRGSAACRLGWAPVWAILALTLTQAPAWCGRLARRGPTRLVKVTTSGVAADRERAKAKAKENAVELAVGFYIDPRIRTRYAERFDQLVDRPDEFVATRGRIKTRRVKKAGRGGQPTTRPADPPQFIATGALGVDLAKLSAGLMELGSSKATTDRHLIVTVGERGVDWSESDGAAEAALALHLVRAGYQVLDRGLYRSLVTHEPDRFAALLSGEPEGLELARTCWADVLVAGEAIPDPPRARPRKRPRQVGDVGDAPNPCRMTLSLRIIDVKTGVEVGTQEFRSETEAPTGTDAYSGALHHCIRASLPFLLAACAQATPDYHPRPRALVPEQLAQPAQLKVAVFDFQPTSRVVDEYADPQRYETACREVGRSCADWVANALVASRRFAVLDRSAFEEISRLLTAGRQGTLEAPCVAAEAGRLANADLAVMGTVDVFRQESKSRGFWLPGLPFAPRTTGTRGAARLSLQLVDTAAGRVLWQSSSRGSKSERDYGVTVFGLPPGLQDFDLGRHPLGETLAGEAMMQAVGRITEEMLSALPVTGRVIAVTDDGIVTSLGAMSGVAEGDELLVYRPAQEAGPAAALFCKPGDGAVCGRLVVAEVRVDRCLARAVNSEGRIERGDQVVRVGREGGADGS